MQLSARRRFIKHTLGAGAALGAFSLFPAGCTGQKRVQVAVLGAGLAGLRATQLLEEQGVETLLLESSDQVGGRTKAAHLDGEAYNLGAVEVGNGYRRLLAQAKRFGLKVVPPWSGGSRDVTLAIDNQLLSSKDWAGSSANHLPVQLRRIAPNQLLYRLHAKDFPLTDIHDWLKPRSAHLDVAESSYLRRLGADDTALALIDKAGNFNDINTVSALHILRSMAVYRFGGSEQDGGTSTTLRVVGGSDRIPKAMAAALENPVLFRHRVRGLRLRSDGVEIECDNGASWVADRVLVTLPFSVLRQLKLDMPIPDAQGRAIKELPYTRITKFVYRVERPFWEEDGLPASMWTKTPMERGFLYRRPNGEVDSYIIWVNGTGVEAYDGMSMAQASDMMLGQLEAVRPAARGALRPLVQYAWSRDPNALGAYAHFAPGQIRDFAHRMADPVGGRVFFAGEHTATVHTGMEGALESAERAVAELLA